LLEWRPVSATGNHTIDGNHIDLSPGNAEVTLQVFVSNWDFDGSGRELRGLQATVDWRGYLGENAVPPNLGVDLVPIGWFEASTELGAFQATEVCSSVDCVFDPTSPTCEWDPLSVCPDEPCVDPYPACRDRPDWVFQGVDFLDVVATRNYAYAWAAAVSTNPPVCMFDDGGRRYLGTLILNVPAGASGMYSVGFYEDPDYSLILDCGGILVMPVRFVPATITIGAAD
jgi:hypothetical protein